MDLLSPEEFANWRRHPTTRAFMAYIAARRRDLMEDWAAGRAMEGGEQHFAKMLTEIGGLAAQDINDYYHPNKEQETDGTGS